MMQTRLLVNLGLLFFLAALLGFIFLGPTSEDTNKQKLTDLNINDINKITIPRVTDDIVLVKKNNNWFMQTPHSTRAHAFRINTLLDLAEQETDNSYNTGDIDIKTFGLDKPRASIAFNDTLIEFGKANPVNNKRYIKSNNKLFLVDDHLYPLISSQPTSFVNLALLHESEKIQKIELPKLTVFKNKENNWKTLPETEVNADDIQNLLQNWQFAKAFGVHAYMPRKSLGKINIVLQNNETIIFEITDDDPWLILARPDLGIEYHLDISNKNKLLSVPEQ